MSDNLWELLAAPLSKDETSWRIDGKPTEKNGRWTSRVVAYCDVPAVVRRLDRCAAGTWTFEASEPFQSADGDGVSHKAIRGTLTVQGVPRSDYGLGPDEKQALTDAFKRTARLFGIALELWDMGPVWTDVSDGGKYAKITGDPWASYQKQRGGATGAATAARQTGGTEPDVKKRPAATQSTPAHPGDFIKPFGRGKDGPISALSLEDLQGGIRWAKDHGKFAEFVDAAEAYIATLDLEPVA